MKSTAYFGVCFFLCLNAAIVVKATYPQIVAQQSLLNYLMSPNVISEAADPAATAACFTKYLPVLSEIGTTFSTQYQACITLANQQITDLTNAAESNRTNFIAHTTSICSAYQACNTDTEILAFFDCYASASEADVSIVYTLQTNATTAAATLSQGLKVIQQEESVCTNNTEETYVKNTAATYQLLDSCLTAAGASTLAPVTVLPINTNVLNAAAVVNTAAKDCSNDAVTRTQTSADGTQTQTQTGPGCQSQNSAQGTQSQSQSGSGTQFQTQCSGADCSEFKPLPPLFTMSPMAPMQPIN